MTRPAADSIWFNASLLTLDARWPGATALAVRAGRIVAIGSDADILALAGAATRRHDLHGRVVMPGLIDTHIHPVLGGVRELFDVSVGLDASVDTLLAAVRSRAAGLAPGRWLTGGAWQMATLAATGEQPRRLLDRIVPAHPAVLIDATYHSAWVNSAALRACGIDAHTPDPQGGRIGRDPATGEPDGLLFESASASVRAAAQPDDEQHAAALAHVRDMLHRLGVTGLKDALVDEPVLRAYQAADRAGVLSLHVGAHLARRSLTASESVATEVLERWRDSYRSAHVHTGFVKLFLDGVAPSRTAAFLEPYLPCAGCATGTFDPDAQLLIDPAALAAEVTELDRRGFVVKMHAVGDRAVRAGLDAIAAARLTNGMSGLRHEIGHTAFIAPIDMPRFAALGAVAEMSPRLWFPNPVTANQRAVLGPVRTNRCHQIRSLMDAGAELTYGSDWPAAATDANPWVGLSGMLTRRNPFGLFEGTVGEDQAITLAQALPLFTTQAARSLGLEHETGSLSVGKSADFIVLEQSPATLTPRQLAEVRPRATVFEGRVVFGAD